MTYKAVYALAPPHHFGLTSYFPHSSPVRDARERQTAFHQLCPSPEDPLQLSFPSPSSSLCSDLTISTKLTLTILFKIPGARNRNSRRGETFVLLMLASQHTGHRLQCRGCSRPISRITEGVNMLDTLLWVVSRRCRTSSTGAPQKGWPGLASRGMELKA